LPEERTLSVNWSQRNDNDVPLGGQEFAGEHGQLSGGDVMKNLNEASTSCHPGYSRLMRWLTAFALLSSLPYVLAGCSSSGSSNPVLPTAASLPSSCTTATFGTNYSCSITVAGGKAPFKWTVTGLPTGLTDTVSADTKTLTISGTPQAQHAIGSARVPETRVAAITQASISVTVTAANGQSSSISFNIALTVPTALTISTTSLPGGTAGTVYSASVTASGGTTPYSWTVTGLPSGITAASATPAVSISGTTDNVGTFTLTAKVTDAASNSVTATLTLTIAQATALAITTTTLPNGTVNVAYSQTLAATGGVAPYMWSKTSGSLPAGLALSSGGVISGTPTTAATSTFTVQVADSESPAQTMSVTLSITINSAAAACALAGKQLAFEVSGDTSAGEAAMVGSVTVASDNSITGALDFRNQSAVSANQSITGATGSCLDGSVAGTGTLSFTAGGTSRTLHYAMRADGVQGFVVESDSSGFSGAGEVLVQSNPTAPLNGSYAFGLAGGTPTAFFIVVGAACTNSSGAVTFLQADVGITGTSIVPLTGASSNAGTLSAPDANGRVTTTSAFNYSNGTTVDSTFYNIDGSRAFQLNTGGSYPNGTGGTAPIPVQVGFVSGKPGANCLPLGQGGSFTNSSIGNSVFSAQGVAGSSTGGVSAGGFIGVVNNFNATAGTVSLTDDELVNGVVTQNTGKTLTYSVSSVGRLDLTNTNRSGQTSHSYAYLDGAGNAYLMIGNKNAQGIAFGIVTQQTAVTPGVGTYAFGALAGPPAIAPLSLLPVTEVSITGTTITDQATGGSTGSYTCDSIGRCTAPSLSNSVSFGDTSIVFYIGGNTDSPTSSAFIVVLQTTAANAQNSVLSH
jgi:hypothetical protein